MADLHTILSKKVAENNVFTYTRGANPAYATVLDTIVSAIGNDRNPFENAAKYVEQFEKCLATVGIDAERGRLHVNLLADLTRRSLREHKFGQERLLPFQAMDLVPAT